MLDKYDTARSKLLDRYDTVRTKPLDRYDTARGDILDNYDTARTKPLNSYDTFDSARDKTFDTFDSAREKTVDTFDSASTGRNSSSIMYYSACESLPDVDDPASDPFSNSTSTQRITAPFYYEDSLRSLVLFGDDAGIELTPNDRTRTPTVEEVSAPTPQPSPKMSAKLRVHQIDAEPTTSTTPTRRSVADSLNKLAANGVRRAKSLKISFRDKSTPAKKLSSANEER